jgi:hypothetical protein
LTLAELIREVRDFVGDEGELYSDEVIRTHLNNGQRELAELARFLQVWTVPVPAGTETVPRPAELLLPKEAFWQDGNYRFPLRVRYGFPPEAPAYRGGPEDLFSVGGDFYLYPVPSRDGELYIVGTSLPRAMFDPNDKPSLTGAERALVAYAVWKLLASTEGAGAANVRAAMEDYLRLRQEWSVLEAQKQATAVYVRSKSDGLWW